LAATRLKTKIKEDTPYEEPDNLGAAFAALAAPTVALAQEQCGEVTITQMN